MIKKLLALGLITLSIFISGCSKTDTNIDNYLNVNREIDDKAKKLMPSISDLPEYKNIDYSYKYKNYFFEAEGIVLAVEYDDKTYKNEKAKLQDKYTYLKENVKSTHLEDKYLIPQCEFSINSFDFSVVNDNTVFNSDQYPKAFQMIGTSDSKNTIAYLYFYDQDLDYIGEKLDKEPMKDFVNSNFDYDFE